MTPSSRLRHWCVGLILAAATGAGAQDSAFRYGETVSAEVKQMYDRGLRYLANTQQPDGAWTDARGQQGIVGLALMAFLAEGDDPNFGRYSSNVRRAVRHIIENQDRNTGFIGGVAQGQGSMYNHGFAMLGLAEAYGAVDESTLWADGQGAGVRRGIGPALDLAVRCAVTSQKNNTYGGWRYSPTAHDADTSVSGAVLVGLLAARNAGIEVPDDCLDRALAYYRTSTSSGGNVAYSGGMSHGDSSNRSAIATLVFAIGKKKDWKEYQATLGYICNQIDGQGRSGYPEYYRYYMAQALFQGDLDAWQKWNRENTRLLQGLQQGDGSFHSSHGSTYGTSMTLLSLALNYRLLPIYER